jgi:hypothetical protein
VHPLRLAGVLAAGPVSDVVVEAGTASALVCVNRLGKDRAEVLASLLAAGPTVGGKVRASLPPSYHHPLPPHPFCAETAPSPLPSPPRARACARQSASFCFGWSRHLSPTVGGLRRLLVLLCCVCPQKLHIALMTPEDEAAFFEKSNACVAVRCCTHVAQLPPSAPPPRAHVVDSLAFGDCVDAG